MVRIKGSSFIKLFSEFNTNPYEVSKILDVDIKEVVDICKSDFAEVSEDYIDILCFNFNIEEGYFITDQGYNLHDGLECVANDWCSKCELYNYYHNDLVAQSEMDDQDYDIEPINSSLHLIANQVVDSSEPCVSELLRICNELSNNYESLKNRNKQLSIRNKNLVKQNKVLSDRLNNLKPELDKLICSVNSLNNKLACTNESV